MASLAYNAVAAVYEQLFTRRALYHQRIQESKTLGFEPWRQLPANVSITNWTSFSTWAYEVRDQRVDNWPLMNSPVPTLVVAAVYITLVLVGMVFMKNRAPVNTGMRPLMIIYNMVVIVINIYMFFGFVYHGYLRGRYSLICNPIDFSSTEDGEHEYEILKLIYIYYLSKLIDFSDTFFMVVRKKFDQVSFLHVYHHSSMLVIWWFGVKYGGGGDMIFGPMLNSFVHIIMYMYYLAALFKTKIPGKSHVTKLQLVQFFMVITQAGASLQFNCPYPQWSLYCQIVFLTSLFVLFMQFYVKAYGLAGDKSRARKVALLQAAKDKELVVVGRAILPSTNGHTHNNNSKATSQEEVVIVARPSVSKRSASGSNGRKSAASPSRTSAAKQEKDASPPQSGRASSAKKKSISVTRSSPVKASPKARNASPKQQATSPASPKGRTSSTAKTAASPVKGRTSSVTKKAGSPLSPKGRASTPKKK